MNRPRFILSEVNSTSSFYHFKKKVKYILLFWCICNMMKLKLFKWCSLPSVLYFLNLSFGWISFKTPEAFFFSPKNMEGLQLLCAKMGRIAAVEIPFCERTIYNLVIDLFMCLHRLSLDATDHVWEANVFMALFLISQAIFFPLHSASMALKPIRHGRLS